MDKKLKQMIEYLNDDLNLKMDSNTIDYLTYHTLSLAHLPADFNNYTVKRFLALYRLEYLSDNKLITKSERQLLNDLFALQDQLDARYSELYHEERALSNESEVNKTKLNKIEKEKDVITKQLNRIEKIFSKYHLLDEIKLDKYIESTATVDNKNIDLADEIEKIKHSMI